MALDYARPHPTNGDAALAEEPEIPVFGNTWDMTTAVQLQYDDPTLESFVALPGTVFDCGAKEVKPGGAYLEPEASALASPLMVCTCRKSSSISAEVADSQARRMAWVS